MKVLYVPFEGGEQPAWKAEFGKIDEALLRAASGGAVRLVPREVDWDELGPLLQRERPDALHLVAHGLDHGALQVKRGGRWVSLSPDDVLRVLQAAPHGPQFVFLTSCYSAELAERLGAAGFAVAGWEGAVRAELTARFYASLYEVLASGETFNVAFASAQAGVLTHREAADGVVRMEGPRDKRFELPPPEPGGQPLVLPRERKHQVLLLLDAYETGVSEEKVLEEGLDQGVFPATVLRLSRHMLEAGVARLRHREEPPDWAGLAEATEALLDEVRGAGPSDGRGTAYYIAGNAPHAVYVHVGYGLSAFAGDRQVLLHWNTRGDGRRLRIDLGRGQPPAAQRYFGLPSGLPTRASSGATGTLGVFVGAMGAPKEGTLRGIQDALRGMEGGVTEVVQILHTTLDSTRPNQVTFMDDATGWMAADELRQLGDTLQRAYPSVAGIGIAIQGPDVLGFLVGRALNPHLLPNRRITLLWHQASDAGAAYTVAYQLPHEGRAPPAPSLEPGAELRRREVFERIARSVRELARELEPGDLAQPPLAGAEDVVAPAELLRGLRTLAERAERTDTELEFSLRRGRLGLPTPLLEALTPLSDAVLDRFARLFVLHELLHDRQGLLGGTWRGVGRAGVVLEDADWLADAWALRVCLAVELRRGGVAAAEGLQRNLQHWLGAQLAGLAAFDRMEQGARLTRLPERRLRRYLIWLLQRARAEAVQVPSDIEQLFRHRLFVELAPLKGRLDGRYDKLAQGVVADTQLFVALDGIVCRLPRLPENFEPGELYDAIRRLDLDAAGRQMSGVVDQQPRVLTPWTFSPREAPAR